MNLSSDSLQLRSASTHHQTIKTMSQRISHTIKTMPQPINYTIIIVQVVCYNPNTKKSSKRNVESRLQGRPKSRLKVVCATAQRCNSPLFLQLINRSIKTTPSFYNHNIKATLSLFQPRYENNTATHQLHYKKQRLTPSTTLSKQCFNLSTT